MSTSQENEAVAQFALQSLKQRTDLLKKAKGDFGFKAIATLASICWIPLTYFGREVSTAPRAFWFVTFLIAAFVLVVGYIASTNHRIDALVKLIGADYV